MLVAVTDDGSFRLRCGPHVARANVHPERTEHDYIEARTSVTRTPRPSNRAGDALVGRGDLAYSSSVGGEMRRTSARPSFGAAQTRRVRDQRGLNAYIPTPTPIPPREISDRVY